MLPGHRDFGGIFVLHQKCGGHTWPPNISGSMWPNLVKVLQSQVSVHYRQEPPSPISDLGTHCPRNVDRLVRSQWRLRSKWVQYKPISQALTVGGQAEANINWADKGGKHTSYPHIHVHIQKIVLIPTKYNDWFFRFLFTLRETTWRFARGGPRRTSGLGNLTRQKVTQSSWAF